MMFIILISGALGFFVFDCYRIHAIYQQKGILFITFASGYGMTVHAAVYLAAGILALFINLDTIERCCGWHWFPAMSQEMVGPLMRGFGIGLAGPAGLSKWKIEDDSELEKKKGKILDDMSSIRGRKIGLRDYLKRLLMR